MEEKKKKSKESPKSDSSLRVVSEGATLHVGGKLVSNIINFVFNVIMTRALGAALFGTYTYANTLTGFFMVFARLGTGESMLRFLPANASNPARRNWIVRLAYLTVLLSSIFIGVCLYLFAPMVSRLTLDEQSLVIILRILAIALPFNSLLNLTNSVFRGVEKLGLQIAVNDLVQPIVNIFVVSISFILGYSLVGSVAAIAIGSVLTLSVALFFLQGRTTIDPLGNHSSGDIKEFYNFSLPLTLKDVGQKLYARVDILMIGLFLSGASVGIYRVSILVTTFLKMPLTGINQLFPSIASGLYSDGHKQELETVYQIITRWTLTIVIPLAITLIIFSQEVLQIFGNGFSNGSSILVLFTVAQFTNCAVGPSGYLLMMMDHQYVTLINQWVLGITNVALNYILIIEFGFIGAAVATAGTLAVMNLIRVLEVWKLENISPYTVSFWKPIVAGILCIPVMALWQHIFSGYLLLFIGPASGIAVFTFLLYIFGIEDEDREFYRRNIRPALEK